MDNIHALAAATRMSHHTHTHTQYIHLYTCTCIHRERERERERGGEGINIISGDIKRHETAADLVNNQKQIW